MKSKLVTMPLLLPSAQCEHHLYWLTWLIIIIMIFVTAWRLRSRLL